MTFDDSLLHLQLGWTFSHLIRLGQDDYQAIITSDDAVVVGTGSSPAAAVLTARNHSYSRSNWLPKYNPADHHYDDTQPTVDLDHVLKQFAQSLTTPIKRRL